MSTELENMPVVSAEKTPKPVASESDGDCYRTFARLSIWLPLGAGVLCRGARAALGGMEGAAAHSALMTCAWFLGLAVMASLVLAIVAISGVPRYGAQGILWRAIRGLIMNVVVVCAFAQGFVQGRHNARAMANFQAGQDEVRVEVSREATNADDAVSAMDRRQAGLDQMKTALDSLQASGSSELVLKAVRQHMTKLQQFSKEYTASLKGILQPSVLDMSDVSQRAQLQEKIGRVRRFKSANEKLQSFVASRAKIFHDDLMNAGVPAQEIDGAVNNYLKGSDQRDGVLVKIREDDRVMGTAMINLLDLMEANWGKWTYNAQRKQITFEQTATLEQYRALLDQVHSAGQEQRALQAKLASLAVN